MSNKVAFKEGNVLFEINGNRSPGISERELGEGIIVFFIEGEWGIINRVEQVCKCLLDVISVDNFTLDGGGVHVNIVVRGLWGQGMGKGLVDTYIGGLHPELWP